MKSYITFSKHFLSKIAYTNCFKYSFILQFKNVRTLCFDILLSCPIQNLEQLLKTKDNFLLRPYMLVPMCMDLYRNS